MKTIDLARKDLLQVFRDRKSLVFLVAMPLAFTLFMGMAYKGRPAAGEGTMALGIVERDPAAETGLAGRAFLRSLAAEESLRLDILAPDLGEDQARSLVRGGKFRGVLVIPRGWDGGLGEGADSRLLLFADPASVEGQALYQAIRIPLERVAGAMKAASIAAASEGQSASASASAMRNAAFGLGMSLWDEATARGEAFKEVAVVGRAAATSVGANPYNQSSPGMLVMFALFGLTSSAGLLVQERKEGTLQRMRSTTMSASSILGGHFLAILMIVLLQTLILMGFGQIALGVAYASAPLGTALVAVSLCFFTAAAGLLIGSFARDAQQVTLFSLVAMFVLSALGGAWFPLEGAGKAFATVAKATPTAWAMTGFQNMLVRGQGNASAIIPSAIVLSWGCALFVLSALRFRKSG